MSVKEYLKQTAQSFFIVVTLINLALTVLGRIFYPSQALGYDMYLYPVLYGFCSMLPSLIPYSPRELTIRQLLGRKLLQMLLIILLLVFFIYGFEGIRVENAGSIAGICISVVVIYGLEEVILWLVNTHHAERLTESLHRYQEGQL